MRWWCGGWSCVWVGVGDAGAGSEGGWRQVLACRAVPVGLVSDVAVVVAVAMAMAVAVSVVRVPSVGVAVGGDGGESGVDGPVCLGVGEGSEESDMRGRGVRGRRAVRGQEVGVVGLGLGACCLVEDVGEVGRAWSESRVGEVDSVVGGVMGGQELGSEEWVRRGARRWVAEVLSGGVALG